MSTPCATPIAWDALVAYWAADLEDGAQDELEAHLMGCVACSAEAARIAVITETFRHALPPLLSRERLAQLRAKGLRIVENPIAPGEVNVANVVGVDVFVHRLGGLALAHAQRVSFEMRAEGTDRVLIALEDAPFDREGNAVLVACHEHYASMPHDVVVDVRTFGTDGSEALATYTIHHLFG